MEQAVPAARVSAFLNEAGVAEQATYQVAFNGLAVEVGAANQAAAARALAKLPGVKAVYTNHLCATHCTPARR